MELVTIKSLTGDQLSEWLFVLNCLPESTVPGEILLCDLLEIQQLDKSEN